MKRISFSLVLVLVLMVSIVGMASAITDGYPDGSGHPYVGLMVAQTADGAPLWRCSGTLVSAKLFVTAGHCTEAPAAHVEIWFESDVQSNQVALGYPYKGDVGGVPYTHPQFDTNAFYLHDLGVVVLDKGVKMDSYGALPQLNQLDKLATEVNKPDITFTAVGYGLQKAFPDAASWKEVAQKVRMVATPKLIQINNGIVGEDSLLLSNNTNTGGTCFGDSGGPNFIGDSNVLGGVTSFGMNGTCGGTGGVYRVDRSDDLNWLYGTFGKYLPK